MSLQAIHQFAEVAEQFCIWAEGAPLSPKREAELANQLLSTLYQRALMLTDVFEDVEAVRVTRDEWDLVYKRFGSLPFNYYMQCADPDNVPNELPGVADLADDLADTWGDLKRGLMLYKAGYPIAASWEWQGSFWSHWGDHAAGGIYALHVWLRAHR